MRDEHRRGTSRQAQPRQTFYPMWGLESPHRTTNAHDLYRYGEPGLLTRYIIPPARVINKQRAMRRRKPLGKIGFYFLEQGLTAMDLLIAAAVAAFMALMCEAFCIGIDGYLETMGW